MFLSVGNGIFFSKVGSEKRKKFTCYISPDNWKIYTREQMRNYLKFEEKQSFLFYVEVVVEKLDFKIPPQFHDFFSDSWKVELIIGNSRIYILGWE